MPIAKYVTLLFNHSRFSLNCPRALYKSQQLINFQSNHNHSDTVRLLGQHVPLESPTVYSKVCCKVHIDYGHVRRLTGKHKVQKTPRCEFSCDREKQIRENAWQQTHEISALYIYSIHSLCHSLRHEHYKYSEQNFCTSAQLLSSSPHLIIVKISAREFFIYAIFRWAIKAQMFFVCFMWCYIRTHEHNVKVLCDFLYSNKYYTTVL